MSWKFKTLEEKDIPYIFKWISLPHVKEYWYSDKEYTYVEIEHKYKSKLVDPDLSCYIILDDTYPVGYIQMYTDVNLEFYQLTEQAVGIDLFIGELDYLHKGYGSKIIQSFVRDIVKSKGYKNVVINPEVRNLAAIKAYEKAGFVFYKVAYSVEQKSDLYYMTLT